MSNGVAAGLRSGAWFRNVVAALSVSLMSSQQRAQAQAADALPFASSPTTTSPAAWISIRSPSTTASSPALSR